ncbi:flagellar basal-body rod protein FlgG [Virgibacillus natechei]|uniref:Flagellar basal-body rod protein FlgG n=1 Tax=Virgibacillus natechei TaxID=1216297 RepID=A0ABS4IL54_9BACI|nr:flagellar hook-basal body protein [Virgibacillus natechei]MBP1971683.1 flagellar basal-body rod protein FlgG [Virgibacillus natechei]UZD12572.1 flagellar hook-basal body protein [Virgibacillus natechei]
MLRGFHTAASGMISQQRQQEALSNNIANAETPGYKADQTTMRAFPEMLLHKIGSSTIPTSNGGLNLPVQDPIGSLNTGVYLQETMPNHGQGDVRETGNATDLALVNGELPDETGNLFFTVQNEDGDVRYTRNGNFTVDGEGFLVTDEGYYVLDEMGDSIQTNGMEFTVTEDGIVQAEGGDFPLGITYAPDANELTKEGNGLFTGDTGAIPVGTTFQVQQGSLEQSNVNAQQTMTQMMQSHRIFETNQRVLRAYDENMGKAVSEIGQLG